MTDMTTIHLEMRLECWGVSCRHSLPHRSGATLLPEGCGEAATHQVITEADVLREIAEGGGNRGQGADLPRSNNGNAGGGGRGRNARGGGDGGDDPNDLDSEPKDMDEGNEEDPNEDPTTRQQGKEYLPRTETGKAMAKMFVSFCQLSHANTRAIVFYNGVSGLKKLAGFQESHWKDTLHSGRSGTHVLMRRKE